MSLARRTVSSTSWNAVTNVCRVMVLLVRSIILARWLPIEVFGIYNLAYSIAFLTSEPTRFGMGGAFLHRAPETEDEDHAAAIHFTLKLALTVVWAALLAGCAFLFTEGQHRTALLLLTATTAGVQIAQTPRLILARRVVHRRLALLQFLTAVLTTVVALVLAWQGATLWALLATDVVALALIIFFLYIWHPVWKPRLAWEPRTVRYFLGFGSRNFLATLLATALDRVDDLWTGFFLGDVPMGFYSKAYQFATYPRTVIALPVNMVVGGTYAELKGDRRRLSQAFFRVNALLVRSGFLFAGVLALVAPEFIRLAIGERWLPMLDAFRLMLVFTLFDPIKATVANLFVAVGRPELAVRARTVQLLVLVAGLFTMGPAWGIAGVALAVDVMLVVGIAILLWQARTFVSFSPLRLFGVPAVALGIGLVLARAALLLPFATRSDWWSAAVKLVAFCVSYAVILFGLERRELSEVMRYARLGLPQRHKRPGGGGPAVGYDG